MYSGAGASFWTSLWMTRNMNLKTDLASCFYISRDICTKPQNCTSFTSL